MWSQAARWPGPDDHAGYAAAIRQGMVSEGPEAIRRRVRDWLTGLLAGEAARAGSPAGPEADLDLDLDLAEPSGYSGWDEQQRRGTLWPSRARSANRRLSSPSP